jgi:hypothetical protein
MSKYLKIAVLILAPIALAFGVWKACSGPVDEAPREFFFADIQTGEFISRGRGEFATSPIKNPATGDYTFYPVRKDDAGNWVILERYRSGLNEIAADKRSKVDMATFVIQTN